MKLQDLLIVLKDNPEINICYLSRGGSIFRGPL